MKRKLSYVLLGMVLPALLFAGCSSSGSSGGVVKATKTRGVITKFGSVFVNGIEFSKKAGVDASQAVTFNFDDSKHAESELAIGMIVTVTGAIDDAAKTGEFESIEFQPEIRGPLDDFGVDIAGGKITVMGRDVVIDSVSTNGTVTTRFDGIADLAELVTKLSGALHPELEISGRNDLSGVFHATLISLVNDDFTAGGTVELEGEIASLPTPAATGFNIGDTAVSVTAGTVFKNMTAADISAGLAVEIHGTLSGSVLTAARVEKKTGIADGVEVNDNVRVMGLAATAVVDNAFTLIGPDGAAVVKIDSATVFRDSGVPVAPNVVGPNVLLEVEGALQADNSILATKVSVESETESGT